MSAERIGVAVLFPELLGTYGDGGNGLVLRGRAAARGLDVTLVQVGVADPVPERADVYLLGGGEDDAQTAAADRLRGGVLERAVHAGAVLLAVCAGFQLAGRSFTGSGGQRYDGLGLLPAHTTPGAPRVVGDLAVEADPRLGLPMLLGYENHAGRTHLESAPPLGRVRRGVGNASPGQPGAEGCHLELGAGLVLATYLHGPVLAQNPALADLLLARVVGAPLEPAGPGLDAATERLRAARLAALRLAGPVATVPDGAGIRPESGRPARR